MNVHSMVVIVLHFTHFIVTPERGKLDAIDLNLNEKYEI